MPENTSYEEAAAITYGGLTALPFLRGPGKIKPGKRVLILRASGNIGTFAVQLAKFYGADVTGVCNPQGMELVRSLGADSVIDYTTKDFTKNGHGYDIIFDTPGTSGYAICNNLLYGRGRYLTTVPLPGELARMFLTLVIPGKKALFAPMGLRLKGKKWKDLKILAGLVEKGHLKPVIDRVYPLEQVADAVRHVENGHKKA